jgi:hypothetical protein
MTAISRRETISSSLGRWIASGGLKDVSTGPKGSTKTYELPSGTDLSVRASSTKMAIPAWAVSASPPPRTAKGTKKIFKSVDGHMLDSLQEQTTDDCLRIAEMAHVPHVPYAVLTASWPGEASADFVVSPKCVIEVVPTHKETYNAYASGLIEKMNRCSRLGIALIQIASEDMPEYVLEAKASFIQQTWDYSSLEECLRLQKFLLSDAGQLQQSSLMAMKLEVEIARRRAPDYKPPRPPSENPQVRPQPRREPAAAPQRTLLDEMSLNERQYFDRDMADLKDAVTDLTYLLRTPVLTAAVADRISRFGSKIETAGACLNVLLQRAEHAKLGMSFIQREFPYERPEAAPKRLLAPAPAQVPSNAHPDGSWNGEGEPSPDQIALAAEAHMIAAIENGNTDSHGNRLSDSHM